eukprot:221647-Chlamydomonas_euryale.AAC.2
MDVSFLVNRDMEFRLEKKGGKVERAKGGDASLCGSAVRQRCCMRCLCVPAPERSCSRAKDAKDTGPAAGSKQVDQLRVHNRWTSCGFKTGGPAAGSKQVDQLRVKKAPPHTASTHRLHTPPPHSALTLRLAVHQHLANPSPARSPNVPIRPACSPICPLLLQSAPCSSNLPATSPTCLPFRPCLLLRPACPSAPPTPSTRPSLRPVYCLNPPVPPRRLLRLPGPCGALRSQAPRC